ncbi:hypothetical protein T03_8459 [Trichinella britovi]|uniref:Uncharacterized protein n=1 Tax=Trichinella britovi TaxID=45882 RepID=A0A0V1CZ22_TRIBR|nr:hypothetical protein T09_3159 [Trichinella sp. T9]KRY48513.1 hypothetical protein T03_14174 [Trichinella britovi]KRY54485.1 hypothetical protein T03_8459 [Trichinella britovi]
MNFGKLQKIHHYRTYISSTVNAEENLFYTDHSLVSSFHYCASQSLAMMQRQQRTPIQKFLKEPIFSMKVGTPNNFD